jgi:hypothetical protein
VTFDVDAEMAAARARVYSSIDAHIRIAQQQCEQYTELQRAALRLQLTFIRRSLAQQLRWARQRVWERFK